MPKTQASTYALLYKSGFLNQKTRQYDSVVITKSKCKTHSNKTNQPMGKRGEAGKILYVYIYISTVMYVRPPPKCAS
ncbi:unnamed protein product [Coffea canephora]|uniref:Uncharacterized protein n=1 Tax=Coffea canephora TaxID=49390 RepID=A0A068U5X7_COFCA|nr:unnamed protein product [Coffea canephora]